MQSSASRAQDITVVITSCDRYDLLERTLASFAQYNTDSGIARILVTEDGTGDPSALCRRFNAELLRSGQRIGQIAAIDRAYALVETPYIFHLEDDWEFYRSGFIERSRRILEADPSTILVNLRAWNDINGHPLTFAAPDRSFGVMARNFGGVWGGLSFNPGLRRLSDYKQIGPYSQLPLVTPGVHTRPSAGLQYEVEASVLYLKLGYRMVILDEGGYVRHIGDNRHVTHPEDDSIAKGAQARQAVGRNAPCPCGSGQKFKHCHGRLAPE